METARFTFAKDGKGTHGAQVADAPDYDLTAGPLPGACAAIASELRALELALDTPLGQRGGVSLWLRTDKPYANGILAEDISQRVLTADGVGKLELSSSKPYAVIHWGFDAKLAGAYATLLPGLPGPQWIHLAFSWDATVGHYAAFANGSPLVLRGARLAPWSLQAADRILVHLGPMALADLRVFDGPLSEDDVDRMVPIMYRGSLDAMLGRQDRGALDPAALRGELLYERSFGSAEDVADWVMEGPGELAFEDGWMRMWSRLRDGPMGHFVYWCPKDFPADYLVEWDMQPISDAGLCIVFLSARGVKGEDIFDPSLQKRDGTFTGYTVGDINSYHVSYYMSSPRGTARITSNMRKNSGFYLVDNGPPGIPAGSTDVHRVAAVKRGPDVELGVEGRRIIRFHDDGQTYGPVLGGGRIGLRQMQWMEARYRDFRVYSLK